MPPCDRCAGDAHLIKVGFRIETRYGQRYAIRDHLKYEIDPACREHPTQDRTEINT